MSTDRSRLSMPLCFRDALATLPRDCANAANHFPNAGDSAASNSQQAKIDLNRLLGSLQTARETLPSVAAVMDTGAGRRAAAWSVSVLVLIGDVARKARDLAAATDFPCAQNRDAAEKLRTASGDFERLLQELDAVVELNAARAQHTIGSVSLPEYQLALLYVRESLDLAVNLSSLEMWARDVIRFSEKPVLLLNDYCHVGACVRLVRPLHFRAAGILKRVYWGGVHAPIQCGEFVEQTGCAAVFNCAQSVLQPTMLMQRLFAEHLWTTPHDPPAFPVPGPPCPHAYQRALEGLTSDDWSAIRQWWERKPPFQAHVARGYIEREETELLAILRGVRPDPLARNGASSGTAGPFATIVEIVRGRAMALNILTAMVEMKATSADARVRYDHLSKKAGYGAVASGPFKNECKLLGDLRLLGVKAGRNGGAWLTPEGTRAQTELEKSTV